MINHHSSAILPVGKVNLRTGKNAMFGLIWNCWPRSGVSCVLFKRHHEPWDRQATTPKYRVVVTCGALESTRTSYFIGKIEEFHHDQALYKMGTWEVVGVFEHNEKGHLEIANQTQSSSLSFSTYK